MVIFGCLSLAAAIASHDFLEADACVHYLYARFAFQQHHLFVDIWGRPFCTALYSLGAATAGRIGAQLTSLLAALFTAWICYRLAKRQDYRYPVLAAVFFLAQPLVFLHSFSELTELPFVLLLALAFWAYQKRLWTIMALLVGLMPAARPEGFGFLLLAAAALLFHRQSRSIVIMLAPLVAWSAAGWCLCGRANPWYLRIPLWVPEHWPYSAQSLYPPGPLLHFLAMLPAVVSPFVFPAVLLGIGRSFAQQPSPIPGLWSRFFGPDHRSRCQCLIALIPLMVLAGHSLLYWTGRMASSGELRYMLVVAPFWALLAARGWEWAFDRCRLPRPVTWAAVASLLPILANLAWQVIPLQPSMETIRAKEVARWYQASAMHDRYPRLAAAHPMVYFFLDISIMDPKRSSDFSPRTIADAPPGTILIWDSLYGMLNADATRKVQIKDILDRGWVLAAVLKEQARPPKTGLIFRFAQKVQRDEVGMWCIFLSPQDAHGRPTEKPTILPAVQ